jgi:hypothetical protein
VAVRWSRPHPFSPVAPDFGLSAGRVSSGDEAGITPARGKPVAGVGAPPWPTASTGLRGAAAATASTGVGGRRHGRAASAGARRRRHATCTASGEAHRCRHSAGAGVWGRGRLQFRRARRGLRECDDGEPRPARRRRRSHPARSGALGRVRHRGLCRGRVRCHHLVPSHRRRAPSGRARDRHRRGRASRPVPADASRLLTPQVPRSSRARAPRAASPYPARPARRAATASSPPAGTPRSPTPQDAPPRTA